MGFSLGKILKIAAPIGLGMINPALGAAAGGILGGLGQKQQGQQDLAAQLAYERPNQNTPFGSQNWAKDAQGNWTGTTTMNPEDQARMDAWRKIAMSRMGVAGAQDLSRYSKAPDYNKMGLGHLASAWGAQEGGTTGQRPWASSPYASLGGNMLRDLQFAGPSANNPQSQFMSQSWGRTPMQGGQ